MKTNNLCEFIKTVKHGDLVELVLAHDCIWQEINNPDFGLSLMENNDKKYGFRRAVGYYAGLLLGRKRNTDEEAIYLSSLNMPVGNHLFAPEKSDEEKESCIVSPLFEVPLCNIKAYYVLKRIK